MIVYHGSSEIVKQPDIQHSYRALDFGKGFYLTDSRETAIRMATKKARLFGGKAILIIYEFDEAALHSDLKVKVFPEKATVEWFLFVDANRDRENQLPIHDYDIIVGPIADDGVVVQITSYRQNIYTAEEAAKGLQDKFLDQQYYFGTEKALRYLKKSKVQIL